MLNPKLKAQRLNDSQPLPTPTVEIEGVAVPMFGVLPSTGRPIAVVDFKILRRLLAFLNESSYYEIREAFIKNLNASDNMTEYIDTIGEELSLRTMLNQIDNYQEPPHEYQS